MKLSEYRKLIRNRGRGARPRIPRPCGMNDNEARFQRTVLGGTGLYECVHFEITRTKRRRYTPDFTTFVGPWQAVVEVKGGYRLHSEDRARLAWEIAAEACDNPSVAFVWARWNGTARTYDCEAWGCGGRVCRTAECRTRDDFDRLIADCLRREGDGA